MTRKLFSFVGNFGFLPHMGDEIEDPFDYYEDYPFLNDPTEPSEDDFEDWKTWKEDFQDEYDDFGDFLRAKQRKTEERRAYFALVCGIIAGISMILFAKYYHRKTT